MKREPFLTVGEAERQLLIAVHIWARSWKQCALGDTWEQAMNVIRARRALLLADRRARKGGNTNGR